MLNETQQTGYEYAENPAIATPALSTLYIRPGIAYIFCDSRM